jgi:hypothetical protein
MPWIWNIYQNDEHVGVISKNQRWGQDEDFSIVLVGTIKTAERPPRSPTLPAAKRKAIACLVAAKLTEGN